MTSNEFCDLPKEVLNDFLHKTSKGFEMVLKVKPGSSKNKLSLDKNGELILFLKAKAIENEANLALLEILSKIFYIPKSKIHIKTGHRSRLKKIEIFI